MPIPRCTGTGTDSFSVLLISIFVRTRLRLRTWIRCYLMPVLFPYLSIWKYSRTRTRTRTSFSEDFRTPYFSVPIFFRTRTRTRTPYLYSVPVPEEISDQVYRINNKRKSHQTVRKYHSSKTWSDFFNRKMYPWYKDH